jgi:hypothetical protein
VPLETSGWAKQKVDCNRLRSGLGEKIWRSASERGYGGETEVSDDGVIKEGKIAEGTPHAGSRLLHFICNEINGVLGQNQMQQLESPRSPKVGADKTCMPSGGEHPSPSGVVYLTPSRFREVLHAKAAVK